MLRPLCFAKWDKIIYFSGQPIAWRPFTAGSQCDSIAGTGSADAVPSAGEAHLLGT
jgi:hypothetical protein